MSARSTKRRCVSTVEALSLAEARVRLLRLLGGGAPGGSGQLGTPRGRGRGHWAPSHCREWLELTASTVADATPPPAVEQVRAKIEAEKERERQRGGGKGGA